MLVRACMCVFFGCMRVCVVCFLASAFVCVFVCECACVCLFKCVRECL